MEYLVTKKQEITEDLITLLKRYGQ